MSLPVPDKKSSDLVHILMAVFNGASTLPAQLDSLEAQTHTRWHLLASDDGSHDASHRILRTFCQSKQDQRVDIIDGPRQGAAANFLCLLRHLANSDIAPRWVAFADQDDVWLPDKLERAIATLKTSNPKVPTLYCSRTSVTQHDLSAPRLSPPRPRVPNFRNALVQNIAAGNTIVLNPAAVELALSAALLVNDVVVHDWWMYQLISGSGGRVIHDDVPTLLYRQHAQNQIGANDTARARWRRMIQLFRGDFRMWNATNIAALRATASALHPKHRATLERFARLQTLPLFHRVTHFRRLGLYRQTLGGTLTLWFAVVFKLV